MKITQGGAMGAVRGDFHNVQGLNVFSVAREGPVDAALNDITETMLKKDSFNQSTVLGNNWQYYQFTLRGDHGEKTFHLKDFVFKHNEHDDLGKVRSLNDFMEMLDRDKLGDAMRQSLIQDFKLPDTAHDPYEEACTPCFWRRTIRDISHPRYKALAQLPEKHLPPLKQAATLEAA